MAVEYRITETGESSAHGDGAIPIGTERAYTIEAIGGAGDTAGASRAFFMYAAAHASDAFGNPRASDGVEVSEVADSRGHLWTGRIKWEFPTATGSAAQEAYDGAGAEADAGNTSTSDSIQWYPFISSFSVAGGSIHLQQSYATRVYPINGAGVDFNNGIGWDGSGFEGVDIPAPAINFEITARTPRGFLRSVGEFLNRILPYVGTVNADTFYSCAPGTVLFNGITSGQLRQGTSSQGVKFSYWEMIFSFSAMPSTVVNIDGVAVPKGGWEYLWNLADENGTIQATYVETVFRSSNFKGLGLGG